MAHPLLLLLTDTLLLLFECISALFESLYRCFVPPEPKNLRGEVALVTGAGHGIGRELALQLARLGVSIVCWDVNESWSKKVAKEVRAEGGTAWAYICDVTDKEQVQRVAEKTREEVGRITLLFNNAGIMPAKPFLRFSAEEIEKVFSVNVFGQIYLLQEFLPDFLSADHGHVVSMCSVAGTTGTPYLVPYCSSKFAVKGLMEGLFMEHRQEHPRSKVKLTTVHPFTINTGLAHEPRTRFPGLIPITEADECARQVIEGVRADLEEVFIPKVLGPGFKLGKCLPRRMQLALGDYLECTVGYKD